MSSFMADQQQSCKHACLPYGRARVRIQARFCSGEISLRNIDWVGKPKTFRTQTFDPTRHVAWPGWQQAVTRLDAEAQGTGQTVVLVDSVVRGCPVSILMCWPVQFQLGSCRLGGNSICLCLTGMLLFPPRRPPWTACIHFRDSYPIDVSLLNFNILCLLLLQVQYISRCDRLRGSTLHVVVHSQMQSVKIIIHTETE